MVSKGELTWTQIENGLIGEGKYCNWCHTVTTRILILDMSSFTLFCRFYNRVTGSSARSLVYLLMGDPGLVGLACTSGEVEVELTSLFVGDGLRTGKGQGHLVMIPCKSR